MQELDSDANIQAFEANRFVKFHSQYLRNRSYWKELRMMQKESTTDSRLLLDYLKRKVRNIRQLCDSWKSFCYREDQELRRLKKAHASISYHHIGESACQMINDAESASQKHLQEILDQIDHQVIPQSMEKVQAYDKAVAELGEKGKACLFACMLMEYRVDHYYSVLMNTNASSVSSTSHSQEPLHERDRFISLVRYYSAVQRQAKLIEQCNQHFRIFFLTAKELENHRMSLIARIADNYLSKIAEALQKMSLSNKTAVDSLKSLPQHILTSQRAFAEELDHRVRDLHPQENGDFERIATLSLQQRMNQFPLLKNGLLLNQSIAMAFQPPTMLDILQHSSSSLRRLFVCHQEEVGYIISSWALVIIAITAAGYLHVIKYPGNGEDLQLPIASVFAKSVDESKFCFDDDICSSRLTSSSHDVHHSTGGSGKHNSATGAAVGHVANTHVAAAGATGQHASNSNSADEAALAKSTGTIQWKNESWRRLMQQVHSEDIDNGHDEENWKRLILQHVSRIHVSHSEHQMVEDREDLLPILHTYDIRQCSVTLRPSAIPSENVIEIVETIVDNTSFFVFSRTSERRLTLKTRVQQDAIQMVSLIQAARTSPNIMTVPSNNSLHGVSSHSHSDKHHHSPTTTTTMPTIETPQSNGCGFIISANEN